MGEINLRRCAYARLCVCLSVRVNTRARGSCRLVAKRVSLFTRGRAADFHELFARFCARGVFLLARARENRGLEMVYNEGASLYECDVYWPFKILQVYCAPGKCEVSAVYAGYAILLLVFVELGVKYLLVSAYILSELSHEK